MDDRNAANVLPDPVGRDHQCVIAVADRVPRAGLGRGRRGEGTR